VGEILHGSPNNDEKVLYLERNRRAVYPYLFVSWLGVSISTFFFSLHSLWFYPFLLYLALSSTYFLVSFWIGMTGHEFSYERHRALIDGYWQSLATLKDVRCKIKNVPVYREHLNSFQDLLTIPIIDIFLPNCGEALEVLNNTFKHVAHLKYQGKLNVYCLDDAARPEVKRIAEHYGFIYMSRPNRGEMKKAGNLQYAFLRSSGDFIVILDADFCPRADFIKELLPYFYMDPAIGIVQSPQYFSVAEHQNWVEKGAGYVQEFFYRVVQPSRQRYGGAICVGTCAMYRREALIKAGGTAQIEHSEDVHTGVNLLWQGYKIRYIPLILAKGTCPDLLHSFFNQQYRWCTGSMSLLFSSHFWKCPVPKRTKLCYVSGMLYYIVTAIGVLVLPLQGMLMVWMFPQNVYWWNYLLFLPSLVAGFAILPRWHKAQFGLYAYRTAIAYSYAHLFALWDAVRGTSLEWSPTGSGGGSSSQRYTRFKLVLCTWSLGVFGLTVGGAISHMGSPFNLNFWPLISFSCFQAYLSLGIIGTTSRKAERAPALALATD
jgi:cellulose synthase (UDP-forming)